ncbi:type IV pilus modification protein PilV [Dyella dinghuensis]|nr:type IV pilus modification protein PilV [Dyella dinghuensis]
MQYASRQRGITLIEVLIALLIFSIGLMGVAGLLVMSARSVHTAYLRTQVTFLAQSMADRMSANVIGVWKGYYNGSYPSSGAQSCERGCTPQQLAEHDKALWGSQLATFLPPATKAKISCSAAGVAYAPTLDQIASRPPYGGSCEMTITWTERGLTVDSPDADDQSLQTFAWEFQP